MRSILFFCITISVLLSACNTNQTPVVPANRIELLNETGFISGNTTLAPGDPLKFKIWVYAHYSFNKIEITSQELTPTLGTIRTRKTITEDPTNGIVFSSNYTTTVAGFAVTQDAGATEKWTFIGTDNQGKMFSQEIMLSTNNYVP